MAKAPKKKADVPAISAAPQDSRTPQVMPTTAVPASSVGMGAPAAGPGGGLLSSITPIGVSAGAYPAADAWLLASQMPAGRTFSFSKFKGDKSDIDSFVIGENNPIQVTDTYGNVLYSGTGYAGAEEAAKLTEQLSQNKDLEGFSISGFDPYTGQWQGLAGSARPTSSLGQFASMVVPAAMAIALPGIGGPLGAALTGTLGTAGTTALGAALGSAGAGIARGQGIGEILQNAALSGGLAYGGASLGGVLDSALPPSGALGGSTSGAGTVARGAVGNIIDVVNNAGSALAGLGSAAGAAAPGILQSGQPTNTTTNPNDTLVVTGQRPLTPFEPAFSNWLPTVAATPASSQTTPNPDEIIVTGPRPITPPNLEQVLGPLAAVPGGLVGGNTLPPETPNPDEIVVTGPQPTPPPNLETLLGPVATIPGGLTDGNILPSEKPADTTSTLDDIRTWLDRLGLTSTVLGALADAVRGGGAGTGVTTPYTSVLGPAPSFGRGAFTPYTGNYETYGFGPEFSFFGQAPAQTTTGPMASLLNPALPVNNTLLA